LFSKLINGFILIIDLISQVFNNLRINSIFGASILVEGIGFSLLEMSLKVEVFSLESL
jgi:hypothetical protein